jgi:RNA polymerase primary sigma factor
VSELNKRELELELRNDTSDLEHRVLNDETDENDEDEVVLEDEELDIFALADDDEEYLEDDEEEEEEGAQAPAKRASSMGSVPAYDTIGLYFQEMGGEPLLAYEEEVALAKCMELGLGARERLDRGEYEPAEQTELERLVEDGREARQRLIKSNVRLVVSIAKKYRGLGMPFPDLIQAGNVGLLKAVDKFDYTRGVKFGTYATWWIRQSVVRSLNEQGRIIRLSVHMSDRIRQLYKISQQLEQDLGHRPTAEQVAEQAELEPEQVRRLFRLSQRPLSLDMPVGEEEESEFGEFIEDIDAPPPDERAEARMLSENLHEMLTELTPREARVLRLRYGLDGNESHTLKEMGEKLGLSRERIRQIEREALRKLRHPRHARSLRHYL